MTTINLRDLFPDYGLDCFVEVRDEDVEAYINTITAEVAQVFFEEERKRLAARRRMYRYKAQYSLDRNDGIESDALTTHSDPLVAVLRKMEVEELYAALGTLPAKQAKRVYAHFVLGMSITDIARDEGVSKQNVSKAIIRALGTLRTELKSFFG